ILIFTFIVLLVQTNPKSYFEFLGFFLLIFIPILTSKVPLSHILKRSLMVEPFILVIAIFIPFLKPGEVIFSFNLGVFKVGITYEGVLAFFGILAKATLSVLSMILLTSTTHLSYLLKALEDLKIPKILIMMISFAYRFLFVLQDELMRMRRAALSRNIKRSSQLKTFASILGTLFLRTYERGERIYSSMLSRGFDGRVKTLKQFRFRKFDLFCSLLFLSSLVAIKVFL
ncbi:MAG: cobalt ECF transporter T component CbiQ, partial [Candidatus Methanofastidiosia archaeon]